MGMIRKLIQVQVRNLSTGQVQNGLKFEMQIIDVSKIVWRSGQALVRLHVCRRKDYWLIGASSER